MNWYHNSTAWKKLRLAKLAAEPLCYPCKLRGKTTPAKVVDHIVPISAGGDKLPPLTGLMSMCQTCHNQKTGAEKSGKLGGRYKGCGVDGSPIDPQDDWYAPQAPHSATRRDDAAAATNPPDMQETRQRPCVAVSGNPGAFQGRRNGAERPIAGTNQELVVANDSQLETDRWV